MAAEVNWEEYFYSIRKVCPWSWAAWRQGEILITNWIPRQQCSVIPSGFQAVVHLDNHNPRQLKKISDWYNQKRTEEEWLWSHPKYSKHSTSVPVLIQQDSFMLESARKKVKFMIET